MGRWKVEPIKLKHVLMYGNHRMSPTPPETEREDNNSGYCQSDNPLNGMQDLPECNTKEFPNKDGEVKSGNAGPWPQIRGLSCHKPQPPCNKLFEIKDISMLRLLPILDY